jgi:hypothetical protein
MKLSQEGRTKKSSCRSIHENWGLRERDLGEGSTHAPVARIPAKQSKVPRNLRPMLRNLIVPHVNRC